MRRREREGISRNERRKENRLGNEVKVG